MTLSGRAVITPDLPVTIPEQFWFVTPLLALVHPYLISSSLSEPPTQ